MRICKVLSLLLLLLAVAAAQNVSSSLRSTIVDPSGASIVGAECTLTNQATQAVATVQSDVQGACNFPIVQPGTYSLTVQFSGFKTLETRNIVVTAAETRTLGKLPLEVGGITESVSVTGEISQIQLATGEKSGTVDEQQLQKVAVKGRDFFALMTTVTGVVDNLSQARETSTPDSIRGTFINGSRENQKNLSIDGITDLDTGSNSTVHFEPNMDAIAEIKILTSNYGAEYGRNGGGAITIITKSGSKDLHGTAYDFYRHEDLNANKFFNNRTGLAKSPYRYRITGYSVGGPIFIPKTFNTNRDKLFFFWSQEYVGMRKDYGTRYSRMPTELERAGDFSQSLDSGGKLITVYDPTTGKPFENNIIPKSRFSPLGSAMLNFLPMPNYVDPDPSRRLQYNYQSAYSGTYPKREDLIRIDANPFPSLQVYWRYVQDKDEQNAPYGLWVNGNLNYNLTPTVFGQPGKGHVIHVNKMFSPTLINEFIFGRSRNNLYFYPLDASAVDRSKVGNPPQWYADPATGVSYVDKVNYMPNLYFSGQPSNAGDVRFGNIPYENYNNIWSFVDNVSKVIGPHTLKAGVYIERTQKFQVGGGNYRGQYDFSTNANNPLDTKNAFSNALVGVLNSYSEATDRVNGDWWFWNVEWFLQDNWRVTKRLTLDIGLRFYHLPPQIDRNHTIATFDPSLYSRANAPLLYVPALNAAGKRVAQDPSTGAFAPAPLIGLFVPGSGIFANGAAVGGVNGYPEGLYTTPWLSLGPRFGFAYDVFGNGKTAIRGGIGVFKDRLQGNPTMNTNGNPPVAYTPTLYFATLDQVAAGGGALGPSNVSTLLGENVPATIANFSLGVQQQVKDFAIDVSYVGGISRHLLAQKNMNPIPMGARFAPENIDTTVSGNKPLPDNFLRPYYGWGDINLRSGGYSANYNALQVAVNRRFARGFQFGASYTYSKTLGVADGDTSGVSAYFSPRNRDYGPLGFDRTHVMTVNYIYDLPNVGTKMGVRPAKWVLDNWQISGITSMYSGLPFTPSLSFSPSIDVTGSTDGARPNVVGDPFAGDTKTFYHWFNQSAIAAPAVGTFGDMGRNVLRYPGVHNWDISISKRIPLWGEGRYIQFRTELFNAWNHTQYSNLNTSAQFNPTTGALANKNFGVVTDTRDPRLIQLSLKVYF